MDHFHCIIASSLDSCGTNIHRAIQYLKYYSNKKTRFLTILNWINYLDDYFIRWFIYIALNIWGSWIIVLYTMLGILPLHWLYSKPMWYTRYGMSHGVRSCHSTGSVEYVISDTYFRFHNHKYQHTLLTWTSLHKSILLVVIYIFRANLKFIYFYAFNV